MMQLWAHRGTNLGVVENTLEAFRKAMQYSPWGLELDVRLCGSGEVVVFHDATLERFAPDLSGQLVEDIPLVEIRDAVPFHVPTLAEFMDEFAMKTKLCIDVKGAKLRSSELERRVIKEVRGTPAHSYEFSSKSIISLARLHGLATSKPALTWVVKNPRKLKLFHRFLPIDNLSISDEFVSFRKNPIRGLKKKGYRVRVYTVNDPLRAKFLKSMGADGIFTDELPEMFDKI